jgi:integrase
MALQRNDIDLQRGVLFVRRTVSLLKCDRGVECGRKGKCKGQYGIVAMGKTRGSLREVPLSARALEALDAMRRLDEENPDRLTIPLLFAPRSGRVIDLTRFHRRQWQPAIAATGVRRPARIYDLRSTFASNALAAGVTVFELAHVMGTSVAIIERHYGALLEDSSANIAARLTTFEAKMRTAS